jgi:hypothetical protein
MKIGFIVCTALAGTNTAETRVQGFWADKPRSFHMTRIVGLERDQPRRGSAVFDPVRYGGEYVVIWLQWHFRGVSRI